MQFQKPFKEAIRSGRVTCSFRNWQRPQARVGGRYNLHPEGAIEVISVTRLPVAEIRSRDIRRSGFVSRAELNGFLEAGDDDLVYRVEFRYLGAELVKLPETQELSLQNLTEMLQRLAAMDRRNGARWSRQMLALIAHKPGTRAADLAPVMQSELLKFKTDVRKLKKLGLTISLETGYRLSPRGEQVLAKL